MDAAGRLPQDQCGAALQSRLCQQRLDRHRHALSRPLERHRPDPAARRHQGPAGTFRHHRPERRRRGRAQQPVGQLAPHHPGHGQQPERLRDPQQGRAVFELHLFPERPGERRPVRPAGPPRDHGPGRQPHLARLQAGGHRLGHDRRLPAPERQHLQRLVRHPRASAHRDHARRPHRRGQRRRLPGKRHDVEQGAAHRGRRACQCLPLQRRRRSP